MSNRNWIQNTDIFNFYRVQVFSGLLKAWARTAMGGRCLFIVLITKRNEPSIILRYRPRAEPEGVT